MASLRTPISPLRVDLAVHRYTTEDISLTKAAEIAGVSWAQMREILLEKGVTPKLGSDDLDEAHAEVSALRRAGGPFQR